MQALMNNDRLRDCWADAIGPDAREKGSDWAADPVTEHGERNVTLELTWDAFSAALSEYNKSFAKELAVRERFRRLSQEWKARKSHVACVEDAILHPAYLRIIGMGSDAVPLILAELERELDHWFPALYAITEAEPVAEADQGKMSRMATAWLEWGRANGFRW